MSDDDDFEVVRGSGNVYHDLNMPDANIRQAKAILSAQIIRILNEREMSTRAAERLTGIAHADFSRIRNARLKTFTIDRLVNILSLLDDGLEVIVSVEPWQQTAGDASSKTLKG